MSSQEQAIPTEAMDQPDHASLGGLLRRSINLQTNDFPIDLTRAEIHKYTIKFSPKNIPIKEKKFLAKRFVQLMLSCKRDVFIYDDGFEILLPSIEPDLSDKALRAVYSLKKGIVNEANTSSETSSHGTKPNSILLTDSLVARTKGDLSVSNAPTIEEGSLQIRMVFTEMITLDLRLLKSGIELSEAGGSVSQARQQVLHALDKVLLREAHHTSSVHVNGGRIFDMESEPIAAGEEVELRSGLIAETCIVNSSVVRRITPCVGFFLKEINLQKLLRLVRPQNDGALVPLEVGKINQLLKGLKIQKGYGNGAVVQVVGLMAGNPDQETFYWNNNKTTTTTVSNYVKKGKENKSSYFFSFADAFKSIQN